LENAQRRTSIAIIGAPEYYDFNQIRFYEHSYSVFSSQWALSGAARALSENAIEAKIYPIRPNDWIHAGYEEFDAYTAFWEYGDTGFTPLTAKRDGADILFMDASGAWLHSTEKGSGIFS
jgi:hypothetical protein